MKNQQKKILMLGGAYAQIPAIQKAKEMGLYVITCDYLPNNPGHKLADEYHNLDTTDKEGVLKLAKSLNINGILSYNSEPALLTAAYVAERLRLYSHPYNAIDILIHKDLFRNYLREHGFNTPNLVICSDFEEAYQKCQSLKFPIIVKPVDSGGSRGITKVMNWKELEKAFDDAMRYARCHRVIIEEFVTALGNPLAGFAFAINGKLAICSFSEEHCINSFNPIIPVVLTFPSSKSQYIQAKIIAEAQRLLDLLHIRTGAFVLEVRVDKEDNVYLMEVAPRHAGENRPLLTKMLMGTDTIEYTIKAALGEDCTELKQQPINGYGSAYLVHCDRMGKLLSIDIDETYREKNMLEFTTGYKRGDAIYPFTGMDKTIGIMISHFDSYEEMMMKTYNFDKYVKVVLE